MAYTREYVETNREKINGNRRVKYSPQNRKAEYQQNREDILKRGKEDRSNCPLCGLDFRRLYIPKHVVTRHKISKEDYENMCQMSNV